MKRSTSLSSSIFIAPYLLACTCHEDYVTYLHPEEDVANAIRQDDVCTVDGSSECALALLQRKASFSKGKGGKSTPNDGHLQDHNTAHADAVLGRKDATHKEKEFDVILRDPIYIALLEKVITANGETLYQSIKDQTWPIGTGPTQLIGEEAKYWSEHYANDFPNTALLTWGSIKSEKLYAFITGDNGFCTAYAPTLAFIAKTLGYFVICPQLASNPTSQEMVMKPVSAVQWALKVSSFSHISLGGQSGGASSVPAAAAVLLSKGISIEAMVMQHPGIVYYMNVPGCEKSCYEGCDSPYAEYCKEYFPSDLMKRVSSPKLLLITGNFCEWSKVQNSNWLDTYGCNYSSSINPPITVCPSMTFPTPSFRPQQPPVTCDSGCPDASFLLHPGDCMVETYGGAIQDTYLPGFSGQYVSVQSCGEHTYGCLLESGLKEEGRTFIAPFLEYGGSGNQASLESILHLNGTAATCEATRSVNDVCNNPLSPFATATPKYFSWGEDDAVQLCSAAAKMQSSGRIDIKSS